MNLIDTYLWIKPVPWPDDVEIARYMELYDLIHRLPGLHVKFSIKGDIFIELDRLPVLIGFPDEASLISFKLQMNDGYKVHWLSNEITPVKQWHYVIL